MQVLASWGIQDVQEGPVDEKAVTPPRPGGARQQRYAERGDALQHRSEHRMQVLASWGIQQDVQEGPMDEKAAPPPYDALALSRTVTNPAFDCFFDPPAERADVAMGFNAGTVPASADSGTSADNAGARYRPVCATRAAVLAKDEKAPSAKRNRKPASMKKVRSGSIRSQNGARWKVNDRCVAVYEGDGMCYEGTVICVEYLRKQCHVVFDGYDDHEVVPLTDIYTPEEFLEKREFEATDAGEGGE